MEIPCSILYYGNPLWLILQYKHQHHGVPCLQGINQRRLYVSRFDRDAETRRISAVFRGT
jgi:hypothetical protein